MGHPSRLTALTAVVLLTAACGDPVVILGDSPGTLRIVAGAPDSAGSELGESGTESRLNMPLGLAIGPAGQVYIADHSNARVLALQPSGRLDETVADSDGPGDGLQGPEAVALDQAGRLIISDPAADRVWRFDPESGVLEPLAGNGERGIGPDTAADALDLPLAGPTGVAAGPDGAIYFTELSGHRVRRLDPNGTLVTSAGARFPGFAGDGGPATEARFTRPAGLALADGTLYIADSGNHRVRAIDLASGTIVTVAGVGTAGFAGDGGRATDALLNTPFALAPGTSAPTLYIAEVGNHRIRVVNLDSGRIETFAGTGLQEFNGDLLSAGETALSEPQGVALTASGFLYVSDTGHHIVRRTAVAAVVQP